MTAPMPEVGRPAKITDTEIVAAIAANPRLSTGAICRLLVGHESGSVRQRIARLRQQASTPPVIQEVPPSALPGAKPVLAWLKGRAASTLVELEVGTTLEQVVDASRHLQRQPDAASAIAEAIIAALGTPAPLPEPAPTAGDGLLVIALSDLHINKLTQVAVTGEAWDSSIAATTAVDAVQHLLHEAHGRYGRIMLTCGNDLLHAEDGRNTTGGTPQDTSDLYHVAAEAAIALMVRIVSLCAAHAPTDVMVVPGNHARRGDWWVGRVLQATFAATPHVAVDCSPRDRLYYRWRHVLLGLTHGDGIKPPALPQLMATEAATDWAQAEHREWLLGHTHAGRRFSVAPQRQGEDLPGVTITTMPAMCAPDVWHAAQGYTGTRRLTQAYLYHARGGRTTYEHVSHTHAEAATAHVVRR